MTGICYFTTVPPNTGDATNLPIVDVSDENLMLATFWELVEADAHRVAIEHDECHTLSNSTENRGGIQIQPKLGHLLYFYGRDDFGKINLQLWHQADQIYGDN